MKHTATLYKANTSNGQGLIIEEKTGRNFAITYQENDAEFIVRACNSHDELLRLLDEAIFCIRHCRTDETMDTESIASNLESALKQAKGGA